MSPKLSTVPKHVGFIMDGNRRWAKGKGLPNIEGHRHGYGNVKNVLRWCLARGIHVVTVFAFSAENWNRSKKEVSYLMHLMGWAVKDVLKELQEKKIQLRIIGKIEELPETLQSKLQRAAEVTKNNSKAILNIAVNYGGRAEILDGVRKLIRTGVKASQLTEQKFSDALYTQGLPDPDLIIRTSGEQRLSGFLLWEAAYAELYFTSKKWPEFNERELDRALVDYAQRKRNFGA
ncbi:MAG: polyprenyl diphosphate synthase [Patescibacteria group bacterium]